MGQWYIISLVSLFQFSCFEVKAQQASGLKIPYGVSTQTYQFEEANRKQSYALFIPKIYNPAKKTPLIVALHGLFSFPRQIIGYPGFTEQAEKHGYIIVAPMGYNNRGWYGSRGKGGDGKNDPINLGELSEMDVMNVLKITLQGYSINENRIYIFGHSMGGGGALHLGIKYPDIWAALAPIAPAIYSSPNRLEEITHVPMIVVQGESDNLVPVTNTRRWVEKMKSLKMDYQYIEVAGGDHILPAIQKIPDIFEFFNQRVRKNDRSK